MYNIYSEEKKLTELRKKYNKEKNFLLLSEKHKKKTNDLALNYQKRIRKFIIDVRTIYITVNIFNNIRWQRKIHI
jgi:hypothetical protein